MKRYDARLGGELQGVRVFDAGRQDEVALWLDGARAVVLGDAVLGDQQGGLRMSPGTSSTRSGSGRVWRFCRCSNLPIAIVLPAHGNAVLEGGSQALEKALEP